MRTPKLAHVGKHHCAMCDKVYAAEKLQDVGDFFERVEPGGIVPSGECPKDGFLTYPVDSNREPIDKFFVAECNNCGDIVPVDEVGEVEDLFERIEPGGLMPCGECGKCGALSYPAPYTHHVRVNAVDDTGSATDLGTAWVTAKNDAESRTLAVDKLWDCRLDASGCEAHTEIMEKMPAKTPAERER